MGANGKLSPAMRAALYRVERAGSVLRYWKDDHAEWVLPGGEALAAKTMESLSAMGRIVATDTDLFGDKTNAQTWRVA